MKSLKEVSAHTNLYPYAEAFEASLTYFSGDELAATTWLNKYAVKDAQGNYLEKTPEDMFQRMSKEFARIEASYKNTSKKNTEGLSHYGKIRKPLTQAAIYELFKDFKYTIPQGSVMATLGNPFVIASLSNCVVVPNVYDSYGGIGYTDQQLAQLFKRRCGVGVDLSNLRPANTKVSNAAGTTTGVVSFMHRFSNTTREVAQNGRRGALMLTLDVAHPDIEAFVKVKQDLTKVTGANISVRLSDEFMQAVVNDTSFKLRFPIDAEKPLIHRSVKARELWHTIIECAHHTAEPGLIFWDRQHHYSPSSVYPNYKNNSTNPCSEIAMQGGDSCRLIAMNLFSMVKDPFTPQAAFDHDKFYQITYESQHLMDDLVDLELEAVERILNKIEQDPEPDYIREVEKRTWETLYKAGKEGRRTGLGFTALADCIAALGLSFDSAASLQMVETIMRTKCQAEFDASIDMAIERGAFVGFDTEIEKTSEFVQMLEKEFPQVYHRMMHYGRRNISISTVAPTGTLSLLAQTSSGIEPVFMLSYNRRRKVNIADENAKISFVDDLGDAWEEFEVYHTKLKDWMRITTETDKGKSPFWGSTAAEIDWLKRVELQALVQKYTTHSISSTINLSQEVSVEQVGDIYIESWKKGLKGITVYREGSRSGVLVANDKGGKDIQSLFIENNAPKRPKKLEAEIVRFQNDYEKWMAVIGLLEGRPYEVFTGRLEDAVYIPQNVEKGWILKNKTEEGNARYDFQYMDKDGYRVTIEGLSRSFDKEYWNYAKLISGVLRHGMPIRHVVDLISDLNLYDDHINTWKNGVARTLKKYVSDGEISKDSKCPSCEDPQGLIFEEGCLKCKSCGYTKCG